MVFDSWNGRETWYSVIHTAFLGWMKEKLRIDRAQAHSLHSISILVSEGSGHDRSLHDGLSGGVDMEITPCDSNFCCTEPTSDTTRQELGVVSSPAKAKWMVGMFTMKSKTEVVGTKVPPGPITSSSTHSLHSLNESRKSGGGCSAIPIPNSKHSQSQLSESPNQKTIHSFTE
jgi:hypothetical protein